MRAYDRATIVFRRLGEVDPLAIIERLNHPRVRRHLPLARGDCGAAECARFVAARNGCGKGTATVPERLSSMVSSPGGAAGLGASEAARIGWQAAAPPY
jgi:hypothetical protein